MNELYDDIIHLPHHVSPIRPQMSRENRAAQFSPFAALTGHAAAIEETSRLTDERIELGESAISVLDMKLNMLSDRVADHPEAVVTYFQPDGQKEGGAYVAMSGVVKRIDDYEHAIVFMNGETIAIQDILDIECELFDDMT